jgi:hypothetical protein
MPFLATILFVALLYVIPGAWLLDMGVRRLDFPLVPNPVLFWGAAFLIYLACVLVVHVGRFAYDELELEREDAHRTVKPFLDARGCRWLTLAGVLVVGSQFAYMFYRVAIPYSFMPLYVALLAGFLDLRRRPPITGDQEALPEPNFKDVPAVEAGDSVQIELAWEYLAKGDSTEAHAFEKKVAVLNENYEKAAGPLQFQPQQAEDYGRYCTRGPMEEIRRLALDLRKESDERGYSPLQEAENVLQMVRSIPYVADPAGVDQPKYPVQTLKDKTGDCEDHAILAAALLWQLGHPVALLYMELESTAHMALGYRSEVFDGTFTVPGPDGQNYSYMETVPSSTGMGEVPEEFLRQLRRATIVPV